MMSLHRFALTVNSLGLGMNVSALAYGHATNPAITGFIIGVGVVLGIILLVVDSSKSEARASH